LIHETSAGGVLFNDDEILILRKPNGEWIMPKGHVERGESHTRAAIREVKEETGLDATIVAPVGRTSYRFRSPHDGEVRAKTVHWFVMETPEKRLHLESTFAEGCFYPVDEALRTLTFDNDKRIVRKAVALRRSVAR